MTRNLKTILARGWVEEVRYNANGRSRPIALTVVGEELLREAGPEWLAAEREATTLLGTEGMTIIVNVADCLLNPTELAPSGERPTPPGNTLTDRAD